MVLNISRAVLIMTEIKEALFFVSGRFETGRKQEE